MTDNRDLAVGMVALAYAERTIKPALALLRARANGDLRHRETVVAVSPVDGTELGHVTRTNPTPTAHVADPHVLMAHLQQDNPDALYDAEFIPSTVSDEQVFAVLRQHAPHLLATEVKVRDHELAHLLRKSEQDGTPAAPGITLFKPAGTTNVYPAKDKAEQIEAVIRAGHVQLNGTVVPMLEGGSHDGIR